MRNVLRYSEAESNEREASRIFAIRGYPPPGETSYNLLVTLYVIHAKFTMKLRERLLLKEDVSGKSLKKELQLQKRFMGSNLVDICICTMRLLNP